LSVSAGLFFDQTRTQIGKCGGLWTQHFKIIELIRVMHSAVVTRKNQPATKNVGVGREKYAIGVGAGGVLAEVK
jgi:hypothetical protein